MNLKIIVCKGYVLIGIRTLKDLITQNVMQINAYMLRTILIMYRMRLLEHEKHDHVEPHLQITFNVRM